MARYTKEDAMNARDDLALFLGDVYRLMDISTPTATRALHALSVLEEVARLDERAVVLFNYGATKPEQRIEKT